MSRDLSGIAEQLLRDYQARTPGTFFAAPGRQLDLKDAYWLQDSVAMLRIAAGDRVVGYKVGCTGPGTTAQFGMAGPIRGCLFESELRRSGDTLDATSFANLAIEGEMAIRVGKNGEIAAVFPVIELHNFVFRGARKTLVELVANNGLNAGVVLPQTEHLMPQASSARTMQVHINDGPIGAGDLWPMSGGAEASLSWLKDHLREHGLPLPKDSLVLAGTPLGLYPVATGDHVAISLDGTTLVELRVA